MKVLNLYAGIGGNRKLWTDCEVTAVELDPEVAKVYRNYFPKDTVIVSDAHQYLLDHYKEFDFIWSSPPCPSHSRINTSSVRMKGKGRKKLEYPDMKLYEEILLLKHWFDGKWVVENVIPYYRPLIPAAKVDRHLFWSNFLIGNFEPINKKLPHIKSNTSYLQEFLGYDLSKYKLENKRKCLRNCVHPETGEYVFNRAKLMIKLHQETNNNQGELF